MICVDVVYAGLTYTRTESRQFFGDVFAQRAMSSIMVARLFCSPFSSCGYLWSNLDVSDLASDISALGVEELDEKDGENQALDDTVPMFTPEVKIARFHIFYSFLLTALASRLDSKPFYIRCRLILQKPCTLCVD